jgi:hypothetical protein
MARAVLIIWLMLPAWTAFAQMPTQAQLNNAVRFGAIAAIGPICGLRDGAWAVDLRRAEMHAMAVQPADRQRADRAGAALSYAEDEALEDFAEAPSQTCATLARNPDLARADQMVAALRAGADQPIW